MGFDMPCLGCTQSYEEVTQRVIEKYFEIEYYAKCVEFIFACLIIIAGIIYVIVGCINDRISRKNKKNKD